MSNQRKAFNNIKMSAMEQANPTNAKLKHTDCQNLLNEALNTLSHNQLKVFKLARDENLSYVQIAE